MERLRWIDSLRGLASLMVAFNHYIMGEMGAPYRTFWEQPAEANRKWFQLPPMRLLFAVHATVPLFMVLGGYCVSIPLIRLRERKPDHPGLLVRRIQSTIVRRFLRLYLPVLVISVLSQLLFYTDSYNWPWFPEKVHRGLAAWSSPLSHAVYVFRYMADLTNIIRFQFNENFNDQVWTIPLELRGSFVVYFSVIALCLWKPRARIGTILILMTNVLWYCHWETFCFMGGMLIAELRFYQGNNRQQTRSHRHNTPSVKRQNALLLTVGLYLVYLDAESRLPSGYQWLSSYQSPHWADFAEWTDIRYCWHSIGGLLIVGAIDNDSRLQHCLAASKPLQYLGQISFSIYLVHVMVFRMLRNPLVGLVWWLGMRTQYGWADRAYLESPIFFYVTWWISGTIVGIFTLYLAHLFHVYVDKKFVKLVRKLDDWLVDGGKVTGITSPVQMKNYN